ncbi:MAG: hypothetical protein V7784_06245 [Oceanospirillaceae bacterium]
MIHIISTRVVLAALFTLTNMLFVTQILAADSKVDYQIQGAVYEWYGRLDLPSEPALVLDKSASKIALLSNQGAHHLMSIDILAMHKPYVEIEVELEFLPKPDQVGQEIVGRYIIQKLFINPQTAQVTQSEIVKNEVDSFTSKYRPSSNANLIRSFVYKWTRSLDRSSESKSADKLLLNAFALNTPFLSEESNDSVTGYLAQLAKLDSINSHRAIKYLKITPTAEPNSFAVEYQYKWNLINKDNEPELAQIAVDIQLVVKDGRVFVQHYKAKYLPPVTDLGAEIRC